MTAVLVDGVVLGLQFAILGVGLTLVYGLGGVVNLAHGQMAVIPTPCGSTSRASASL